ncbi:MAG: hypothetical protein OXE59_10210 [Bacteroidetes bacterium]|nr:hypothetical protein [Bacteroidota bacterium]
MKNNDSSHPKGGGNKPPSVEIVPIAKQRRFSASYKLRILEAAYSGCQRNGGYKQG